MYFLLRVSILQYYYDSNHKDELLLQFEAEQNEEHKDSLFWGSE